jgi:hypothetical protein
MCGGAFLMCPPGGGKGPAGDGVAERVGGRVAWGDSRLQGSVAPSSRTSLSRERFLTVRPSNGGVAGLLLWESGGRAAGR